VWALPKSEPGGLFCPGGDKPLPACWLRGMWLSCSYVVSTVISAVIRSRIDPASKKEANRLLRSIGLTMSDAIRLFLQHVIAGKGLAFAIETPNATTIAAMEAADRGEVEETSLAELARLWEGACAKSSRPRSSRKT
jgi:DNA-damage-inducible protein J